MSITSAPAASCARASSTRARASGAPAVGERVGRRVDDAHQPRPAAELERRGSRCAASARARSCADRGAVLDRPAAVADRSLEHRRVGAPRTARSGRGARAASPRPRRWTGSRVLAPASRRSAAVAARSQQPPGSDGLGATQLPPAGAAEHAPAAAPPPPSRAPSPRRSGRRRAPAAREAPAPRAGARAAGAVAAASSSGDRAASAPARSARPVGAAVSPSALPGARRAPGRPERPAPAAPAGRPSSWLGPARPQPAPRAASAQHPPAELPHLVHRASAYAPRPIPSAAASSRKRSTSLRSGSSQPSSAPIARPRAAAPRRPARRARGRRAAPAGCAAAARRPRLGLLMARGERRLGEQVGQPGDDRLGQLPVAARRVRARSRRRGRSDRRGPGRRPPGCPGPGAARRRRWAGRAGSRGCGTGPGDRRARPTGRPPAWPSAARWSACRPVIVISPLEVSYSSALREMSTDLRVSPVEISGRTPA